jgi:hypothetical protein
MRSATLTLIFPRTGIFAEFSQISLIFPLGTAKL